MSDVLFQTDEFKVRQVSFADKSVCFVTFASFTDIESLDQPGFGENFFRQRHIDAIHVIVAVNRWYKHPGFERGLAIIRNAVAGYDRVIAYGSSMGGYAAIRFAETVGAELALAISPQYSLNRRISAFDGRWRSVARSIPEIEADPPHSSPKTVPVVFFDPSDLDRLHWRLIVRNYPRAIGAPLRHAGHPAGAFLNETGLLAEILLDAARGRLRLDGIGAEARRRRRKSGQYLFTLARNLGPTHEALKLRLAYAACTVADDATYLIYAALLEERRGAIEQSAKLLARAIEALPDHAVPLAAAAAFELRRAAPARAVDFARRLNAVNRSRNSRRLLAATLIASGEIGEARAVLRGSGPHALAGGVAGVLAGVGSRLIRRVALKWLASPYDFAAVWDRTDQWRRRQKSLKAMRRHEMRGHDSRSGAD